MKHVLLLAITVGSASAAPTLLGYSGRLSPSPVTRISLEDPSAAVNSSLIALEGEVGPGLQADIFLYNRSTSSMVPLPGLNSPSSHELHPSRSNTGRFIAFSSDRSGNGDIFLYDRNTSSLVPLSGLNTDGFEFWPSISGDGRYIAFARQSVGEGDHDVGLYDRVAAAEIPLPAMNGSGGFQSFPSLSADGTIIAYQTGVFRDLKIYHLQRSRFIKTANLNVYPTSEDAPALSEDARYLAFHSIRNLGQDEVGGGNDIFLYDRSTFCLIFLPVLNALGKTAGTDDLEASVSNDGNLIAFASNRSTGSEGDHGIFLYDRTARALVPLPGLNDSGFPVRHPSIR